MKDFPICILTIHMDNLVFVNIFWNKVRYK